MSRPDRSGADQIDVEHQATDLAATQPATGVSGAAYYNNDLDPDTATTLFTVDPSRDQVAIQSPANAGLLAATGTLGVDVEAGSDAGFDIHYSADGARADGVGWPRSRPRGPPGCTGWSC